MIKKLKLHRFATVIRYLKESWSNSKFVVMQEPKMNRLHAYFSLLYWFYFYGNDFNDYCTFQFWGKSKEEKKTYISLRRNNILRFALSTTRVYEIFLDKVKFNRRFSDFISRKWIEVCGDSDGPLIRNFISTNGIAIFKPRAEFGGHGIVKYTESDSFGSLCEGVLEECIENSECIKRLAPGSLNTVRIVTVIDKFGNLHIIAAVLRMGNGTAITDNYHDGGMACAIDITTGILKGNAYGMGCKEYIEHPFSRIKFDGYLIEGFQECIQLVKELAYVEPEARYVGWDFAITPNGIDIIEGNIPPGEDITQLAAGKGLWNEIQILI